MNTFRLAGEHDHAEQNLDADFASFHVFNSALSLTDANEWKMYVDNGYNDGPYFYNEKIVAMDSAKPVAYRSIIWC